MPDIDVKAYTNCDDVHLVWNVTKGDGTIPGCLGFAIECRRPGLAVKPLVNRVGFAVDAPKEGEQRPSTIWPFQRYNWTDHAADLGDSVGYRVVAMCGQPGALTAGPASDWTPTVRLSAQADDDLACYFNRGFVISQFASRLMAKHHLTLKEFKAHAAEFEDDVRIFLSGELRKGLFALLDRVRSDPHLYLFAALYELGDQELINKLVALADRAQVVLSNGSTNAAGEDENSAARGQLVKSAVRVFNRMLPPHILGHNKFVVVCKKVGSVFNPVQVWTGSTNWTPTGLCTQVNNAILLSSKDVAGEYFAQWKRLRDAGDAFPDDLVAANSQAKVSLALTAGSADVWFTRTSGEVDIAYLKKLVRDAKQGILFTMFNPGAEPLNTILDRQQAGLYVRGVVNQLGQSNQQHVALIRKQNPKKFFLDVVEPEGIQHPFASWAGEVTRKEFLTNVGWAITHSKIIVIDPFGETPTVVTGSHNFSDAASQKNDENFIVVKGVPKLAQAYAVACVSAYQHYRWRSYLIDCEREGKKPFSQLKDQAGWQADYRKGETLADLHFWL